MRKLYSPRCELLGTIPDAEFDAYLVEESLNAIGIGESSYIVVEKNIAVEVKRALAGEYCVIGSYYDMEELLQSVNDRLRSERKVVIRIGTKMLRKHFNTTGFVSDMEQMIGSLHNVETFIPPGRYGTCHLLGVASLLKT